jgi:hypothetical protein
VRLPTPPFDAPAQYTHYSPIPTHEAYETARYYIRAPPEPADVRVLLPRTAHARASLSAPTNNQVATGLMTAVFARSPLQPLPMATNRATARRRSARTAFEDDDAPIVKRAKTEANGPAKKTNGVTRKAAKTGELVQLWHAGAGCPMASIARKSRH